MTGFLTVFQKNTHYYTYVRNSKSKNIYTYPQCSCRYLENSAWNRKSWLKFKNRDDQSTSLSILVEKLEPSITMINWSQFRPKNEAYFVKAAYRRSHFRDNFISGKMFAVFRNSGSVLYNFRIFLNFLRP